MSPQLAASLTGAAGTEGADGGQLPERMRRWPPRWAIVVSLMVVFVGVGALGGAWWNANRSTPTDTSVEAGFARDMQTHHAQAVQMAMIVRDKTGDPTLRALSYDIVTTQQQQIGQMYAWLTMWHLPQTSTEAPMAWMSSPSGGHSMPMTGAMTGPMTGPMTGGTANPAPAADLRAEPSGQMPGMASQPDLDRLTQATGSAAEIQFLQLMIAHHQGGVTMAQAALDRTSNAEVSTLASAIVTGQQAEIEQMRQLLQSRQAIG